MFWIDLEMSGLDQTKDVILEAAAVVTDLALTPLEKFDQVVFQPPEVLQTMHPWCIEQHGKTGLTAACASGAPLHEVESGLLALVDRHWSRSEKVVLCGNSVGTDRRFILHWMPRLAQRLHYRILDVSSFKVVFKEMFGVTVEKAETHRAIQDIDESIAELKHYLQFVKVERPESPEGRPPT